MLHHRVVTTGAARRNRMEPFGRDQVAGHRLAQVDKERDDMDINFEAIFLKYDTNRTGRLERDNVTHLLTDFDHSTPAGTPPSQEELDFIFKVCDEADNGAIERDELENAIVTWRTFASQREAMEKALEEFDQSKTGKLNKDELKNYLTSLNHGHHVSDREVDYVMQWADVMGDGNINQSELVMATSAWYVHLEGKKKQRRRKQKSTVCTLL